MSLSELWSLYGQNYIDALLATWGMTLESFAIAMVLAVAVTVMRVSPLKPLRVFGDLYVQVFRNIPGIALLIIVVYALPARSRSSCPTAPASSSPQCSWVLPLAPRTL